VGVLAPWVDAEGAPFARFSTEFPVLIPATTLAREFADYQDGWYGVRVLVRDAMQAPAALRQLDASLLPRLRLPRNVRLYPRGDIVSAVDLANRQRWAELRAAAGGVAALLIAIVGLVNMLLVSVHENIREVGLRRALGALRSQVGWQFVREGTLLAILGSVLGVGLTLLAGDWLGRMADVPVHVPIAWVFLSALGAILAGCLASLAPALHAARIHPVEALRYE
jgi:predicted lysophospholipase L1 biosynthesis ABC-type transport system permease subunit